MFVLLLCALHTLLVMYTFGKLHSLYITGRNLLSYVLRDNPIIAFRTFYLQAGRTQLSASEHNIMSIIILLCPHNIMSF